MVQADSRVGCGSIIEFRSSIGNQDISEAVNILFQNLQAVWNVWEASAGAAVVENFVIPLDKRFGAMQGIPRQEITLVDPEISAFVI